MDKNQFESIFPDAPESFDRKIHAVLESLPEEENMSKKIVSFQKNKKTAVACAAVAVLAITIPVSAGVLNYRQQRMAELTDTEKEEISTQMEERQAEADSSTRDMTKEELVRYAQLEYAYESEGRFPDSELAVISSDSEVVNGTVCYDNVSGMLYLPDRDLTDEELLQIIDYRVKQEYILEEENADVYAEAKENRSQEIAAMVANGGLDENGAIEAGKSWLADYVDVDLSNATISTSTFEETYEITIDMNNGTTYYIDLDGNDGSFLDYTVMDTEYFNSTVAITDDTLPELDSCYAAVKEEIAKHSDVTLEKVLAFYNKDENGNLESDMVTFQIEATDGSGLYVSVRYTDHTLLTYQVCDDYEEELASMNVTMEENANIRGLTHIEKIVK